MIFEILCEDTLMRNPFDDDDDITKPEIANYVFYGKKTKFEKQQCSYSDLRPHILNKKIDRYPTIYCEKILLFFTEKVKSSLH